VSRMPGPYGAVPANTLAAGGPSSSRELPGAGIKLGVADAPWCGRVSTYLCQPSAIANRQASAAYLRDSPRAVAPVTTTVVRTRMPRSPRGSVRRVPRTKTNPPMARATH
jgi:hypothetical protein